MLVATAKSAMHKETDETQAQNTQAAHVCTSKEYLMISMRWEGDSSSPRPFQGDGALGNVVSSRAKPAANCLQNCHATNYMVNISLSCWH
jgi:hypothetical protein